jgi:hypothetical protein
MRGMQEIATPRDMRTIHSAGVRTLPKTVSSCYLQLYMLKVEENRLKKELFITEKRMDSIRSKFNDISKRINTLQAKAKQ